MNTKLLSPDEVNRAVEQAWRSIPNVSASPKRKDSFGRSSDGAELRGVYWAHMPEYAELNFFDHTRPLPNWFWTGETKMACLRMRSSKRWSMHMRASNA